LTGLAPGTTFHYSAVATNSNGTSLGADHTFKTSGLKTGGPPVNPGPGVKKIRCKVPRLIGLKLRTAKKRLKKAHCKLGQVTRKKAKHRRHGRIFRQSPRAGVKKSRGTKVAVVVAL
jgi:hypothetical protein